MADSEALRTLNRSVADLEQRRDEDAIKRLDDLLAPDLLFRRASGEIAGKAAFMAGLEGRSLFMARTSKVTSVDVVGDRAVVVVMVTTEDAEGTTATFRNVRLLSKTSEGWRIGFWFNDRWEDTN